MNKVRWMAIVAMVAILVSLCGATAQAQMTPYRQAFVWPVSGPNGSTTGRASVYFDGLNGFVIGRYHTGLDISPTSSTAPNIVASSVGRVYWIGRAGTSNDHNFGNTVILQHRVVVNGNQSAVLYTQYSHMASISPSIAVGNTVYAGRVLGVMGKTGDQAYPVHLHFEVKLAAVLWNPVGPYQYVWGYVPFGGSPAEYYGYLNPGVVMFNYAYMAYGY